MDASKDMLLRTLGSLELAHAALTRPKPLLLLCYLALEGPKERRHLAELFFLEAADPLNRLAVTLSRLRKVEGLVSADTTRAWTDVQTDAGRLLSASEGAKYDEVVALYKGPFLESVVLGGGSSELEDWIYSTRDFLASQVKTAHLALAGRDAAAGRFQDAATRAERAYRVAQTAGLEPEDIRRAHTLLLAGNHPHAATLFKEAAGFDLELCETADEARRALGYRVTPPTNLGSRVGGFVGREEELARLASLLASPDARLVSVIGGGGVGKTRLATEAARGQLGLDGFKDGVYFVALDAVSSSRLIPAKIAEALGLEPESGTTSLDQVQRHLADKAVLFVLDNFEHLLDGATLLPELLDACPRLKLLVTSREGLNLKEEWRFVLHGLPFSRDLEPPLAFAATRLFVARARQVQPAFEPDPDTLRAVQTICKLVEGYPLGLELAATLVRALPCADVAAELGRDLDVLAVSTRDAPDRHRSLRALFEHSWNLLTAKEKSALRRLAVFRGGFTRAAAEVVGATIPLLASLIDKSLLRVSEAGRYDRHPLLYQYTQEKLAEHLEEKSGLEAKHAAYFSSFSAGLRLQFNGPDPKGTLTRLEADFENCRAAWRWALEKRDAPMMLDFTAAFWFYYGNWEGSEAIHRWAEALKALNENDPAQREASGYFLALQAQYYVNRSLARAKPLAEHALALLRPFGNELGIGMCFGVLVIAAEAEGRFDEALALLEAEPSVPDLRGEYPVYLAWLEINRGNYREAKKRLFEALEISRSDRFTRGVVGALHLLGDVHVYEGDYEAARHYYVEGLALARDRGFAPGGNQEDACLLGLGKVAFEEGNLGAASAFAEDVLVTQKRPNDLLDATLLLGRVATARGDFEEAITHFRHALHVLKEASGPFPNARVADFSCLLLPFAELWVRQGKLESAAAVLGLVLRHVYVVHERAFAERLLGEVRLELSNEALEAALRESERTNLERVVQEVATGTR